MPPAVLLVYANPMVTATPVPPYGLERVGHALSLAGCRVTLLLPWLEADPLAALRRQLDPAPAMVGFSFRNLDDALVVRGVEGAGPVDTASFVGAVRPLVRAAVAAVGPERVVVGGAGVTAGGEAVVRALGASLGVRGAADDLAWRAGRRLVRGETPVWPDDPRVIRAGAEPAPLDREAGRAFRQPPGPTPRLGAFLGLVRARQGRVPVQVSTGCDRRCAFCVEPGIAGGAVVPRDPDEVAAEVDALVAAGFRRFWLVASEINVAGRGHLLAVLRRLAGRGLDLQAFVQPAPMDDAILDAMEEAGLDPEGLSFEFGHLDDRVLRAGGGPANRAAIDRLVETWLRRGYRTLGGSVLLGGHPAETEETLAAALDAALAYDRALPGGLGLSYAVGARVYAGSRLGRWVRAHPDEARPHLYARGEPDPELVRPVVFCRPGPPRRLLARVGEALAGARGDMGPMNTEAPAGSARLEAEARVNRGLWLLEGGDPAAAEAAFLAALDRVPDHLEALARLGLVRANHLGRPEAARAAFERLLAALAPGDPRRAEVRRAISRLDGSA